MKSVIFISPSLVAFWVGLLLFTGCGERKVLGKKPTGSLLTVSELKSANLQSVVMIKGVLVGKCPVAGCWFYLRDKTGTIKVDTKAAGFVVLEIPLQTEITVAGMRPPVGDFAFDAVGLEYQ
jgi:uncharacterized protein YdeI (BOF family)